MCATVAVAVFPEVAVVSTVVAVADSTAVGSTVFATVDFGTVDC